MAQITPVQPYPPTSADVEAQRLLALQTRTIAGKPYGTANGGSVALIAGTRVGGARN